MPRRQRPKIDQAILALAAKALRQIRTEAVLLDALRREPDRTHRLPLCRLYAIVATEVLA